MQNGAHDLQTAVYRGRTYAFGQARIDKWEDSFASMLFVNR
jgi:hypothetical protein